MDKRRYSNINQRVPGMGSQSPANSRGNGRVPGLNGLHGIKQIHMSVAKGPKNYQKKDVFKDYDPIYDKQGSMYSDHHTNQEINSIAEIQNRDEHLAVNGGINGRNEFHQIVKNGQQIIMNGKTSNDSPFQNNAINSGVSTNLKSHHSKFDVADFGNGPYFSSGSIGQNGMIQSQQRSATLLGMQLATGLYNRYQSTKSKPGTIVANHIGYEGNVDEQELPETALDAIDYTKRLRFEELKKTRLDAMQEWKQKDVRGIKKNAYIKEIQKKNSKILTKKPKDALEQLEVDTDRFPLLQCRKAIRRVFILLQMICYKIIKTSIFENISICVIIANSAVMVVDDPAAEFPDPIFKTLDDIFNLLYLIEMILKIIGLGFIFGEDAYLRDSWNILDFVIVMSAIIPYIQTAPVENQVKQEVGVRAETGGGASISGLRSFRVLRPLRTITSIKGLKVLIMALLAAIPLLRDTLLILLFFFIVFSIGCLQLLAGSLKQRCISIQTGMLHPDDILCGSSISVCPGGYFCGKQNNNPNYGVTNFDSIQYSLLNVFQCVTLEGWSVTQTMMQRTFHDISFIIFITMILVGAFFLLNLLLAVINSKFTEAHSEHLQQEKADKLKKQRNVQFDEDDMDNALNNKDEWTISQAITARIYAKKMKAFLYRRREQRAAQLLRLEKSKKQKETSQQTRRNIQGNFTQSSISASNAINGNGIGQHRQSVSGIIEEEDGEHQEEIMNEDEKHLQEVQHLVQSSKIDMQRIGKNVQDLQMPKSLKANFNNFNTESDTMLLNGAQVKIGNIAQNNKKFLDPVSQMEYSKRQKKLFSEMAEQFDIDNVIPKAIQKNDKADEGQVCEKSIGSFDLSLNQYDGQSERASSRGQRVRSTLDGNGYKLEIGHTKIPQIEIGEASSGLISSDSDFEEAAAAAGYTNYHKTQNQIDKDNQMKRNSEDLKKDVSKTFKKMLTANQRRTNGSGNFNLNADQTGNFNDSTKYEGSKYDHEFDSQTQMSEIETKFLKKKKNFKHFMKGKLYKEDYQGVNNNYDGEDLTLDQAANEQEYNLKQLEEFISTKRPKDPFLELKPLTEKVVINTNVKYQGSSTNEIFQQRILRRDLMNQIEINKYLKVPQQFQEGGIDPDWIDNGFVKTQWLPYQQKVEYDAVADSSDIGDLSYESPNEDDLCAQTQPYETATMIAYRPWLKQIPIVELARRSDIVITSTLSQNLISKDKRLINEKCFALMKRSELREYIDELNAFKAMEKEIYYRNLRLRDKDKEYRDNYTKSFIHRSKFQSNTLKKFKKSVQQLNSNKKIVPKKSQAIKEQEKTKFEQNKRAVEKRGLPSFNKQDAQKLLEGKYHDDEEAEEGENPNEQSKQEEIINFTEKNLCQTHQLEQFENEIHKIFEINYDEQKKVKIDEIPADLRREFQLPQELMYLEVDFKEIRKFDAQRKRNKPIWSGQDVIPDHLDYQKSLGIISIINKHRVWPLGITGLWKRIRFVLRLHVKSDFFDNLMTFAVVLNTITLSLDQYNQPQELADQIEEYNTIFTYLFIYEMGTKILALGISKYVADKMNWLDGSVVLLSIFEIIYQKMQQGQGVSLSAFKTMRLFRTFRVFRIARLLRALSSMQMILRVIATSYMSYVYITALLFLFIFIFVLLGMQMFGGQMNYIDGLPRGNFDDPSIAFLVVFQVLTMENWQAVLYDLMRGDIDKILISVYLIAWVFIGNFILLNLFLAILLDSFIEEGEEDEDQEERIERIKLKQQKAIEKAKRLNRKKVYMKLQRKEKPSKLYFGQVAEEVEEDLEDLDEEQIIKIFQSQGILKKTKKEIEEETILYDGIDCAMSIYIFSKDSSFRTFCYKLWKHKKWENIVMALILLSSAKLATDTFNEQIDSQFALDFLDGIDLFFNYAFIVEMCVKIIAMGLVMDNGSYLEDSWNQLDFFIVMSSIADMSLTGFDLPFIRILRMLRVLRPLRFISRNVGLRMIVVALLDSVSHIFNVLIVVAMVYLIFAILGVNFMMGHFFYCSIDPYVLHTEQECLIAGGSWEQFDHNFDNVLEAYISLFVVSSLEGWPDICIQALDMTSMDEGPAFEANPIMMVYFVIFILLGSFFLLNFFIGVLFLKFNQAQKEEQKGLTNKDMAWMDIQKLILQTEPEYTSTNVPKNPIRKQFHILVSSDRFDIIIMSCIILNMIQMGCFSEGMSEGMIWFLDFTNIIFTIVFIIEAILKLVAFGGSYFENSWNKFDFFVVCSSIMDFVLSAMDSSSLDAVKVLPQLARVMRVLRVTRLLKFAEGLQAIIQTIMFSIPSLANVFGLLMLIFFMFAVSGNSLFREVKQGEVIDDLKNFGDFKSAFILLFAVSTGEDWNKIMFDCSRTKEEGCIEGETCGSRVSFLYFMLLILFCTYVMLNLFILVIIQQFEKYYLPKDNMIVTFKRDLSSFMRVWKTETQERYRCQKIKEKQLPKFFRELGNDGDKTGSLGFGKDDYEPAELKKQMLKMAIKSVNGYVYFNELLYRCMRRKYGLMKINKKMQIFELLTQYRIYLMTLEKLKKGEIKYSNDDIKHALVKKENGVNPFLTVMNFRITFRAWSKAARRSLLKNEREKALKLNELDQDTFDETEGKNNLIAVEIDVENIYSATSEEDEQQDQQGNYPIRKLRSGNVISSISQGSGSAEANYHRKKQLSRTQNHLQRFQRKMTTKFQENIIQQRIQNSQQKGISIDISNDDGKNLKASIMRSLTKRQRAINDLTSSTKFRVKAASTAKK